MEVVPPSVLGVSQVLIPEGVVRLEGSVPGRRPGPRMGSNFLHPLVRISRVIRTPVSLVIEEGTAVPGITVEKGFAVES